MRQDGRWKYIPLAFHRPFRQLCRNIPLRGSGKAAVDEGEEYDAEEAELLREELGEEDEKEEPESDDLDFDRVKSGSDSEEGF